LVIEQAARAATMQQKKILRAQTLKFFMKRRLGKKNAAGDSDTPLD
jgi:hypothetical protein